MSNSKFEIRAAKPVSNLQVLRCGLAGKGSRFYPLVWLWPVVLLLPTAWAQNFGEIKGLKLAEPYPSPHETQLKSLLEAAKARRLPDGSFLCTDAKLQTFTETGARELVVQAPECLSGPSAEWANSAGPLKVQTADGKFTLEGVGFLWMQTNSILTVSNQVHTTIHQDLLAPGASRPATNPASADSKGIQIFSDRFDYSKTSGQGIYQGNVQASGTNFGLESEKLTVELPMNERRLQRLTAERKVTIHYTNTTALQASAEHAIYSADTGLIRLTGHPTWKADRREGRGDELVIDNTNRIFQAIGNAWLRMPTEGKTGLSFWSSSNSVPAKVGTVTNQFVDIQSDRYEFRTNTAQFQHHVVLKQWSGEELRGKMTCAEMTANFSGSNELQTLVAQTNVVIEAQERRLTGGHVLYTGTNGWLELTQNPTWKAGTREGKGDIVGVSTHQEEMVVRGHAYLRLPAEELGKSMSVVTTNAPRKTPARSAELNFGEIRCQEYTITPAVAVFEGGVHAKHPQMDWVCDHMSIHSLPADGKVLFADQGVIFTLIDEKGQRLAGKGEHVIYTNNVTRLLTNDILYLRGSPASLLMTNNLITNPHIVYDRAHGILSFPGGEYKITGTNMTTDTNMFKLPKNRHSP